MARLEPLLEAWAGWETHVLVLLSFALQVTLVVLADIRRRVKSTVLSSVIWSAYMLADTTAIYALGHFSVTGMSAEHELMALWAPLLLVHLGGPDNITAYAVEDNRLWLRHLQSFGLQSVAAAYVLYQSSLLSRPTWLRASAILMLLVGVLKYGERVWALKRASSVHSSALLRFPGLRRHGEPAKVDNMYRAIQMHLSEMYCVFYSKAEVMNTLRGTFIHVITLAFSVALFLTFHLSTGKDEYNRVDVTATYTLLIGLLVLEATYALRLIFSTATILLLQSRPQSRRLCLGRLLESMQEAWIHTFYCSGSMRQLELLHLDTRIRDSRRSRTVRWMGWWGRWVRLDFSRSIRVTTEIIEIIEVLIVTRYEQLFQECEQDIVVNIEDSIGFLDEKLENRILVWHIATHVLLDEQAKVPEPNPPQQESRYTRVNLHNFCLPLGSKIIACIYSRADPMIFSSSYAALQGLANAARALSNYTIFLLATHPQIHSDPSCSLDDTMRKWLNLEWFDPHRDEYTSANVRKTLDTGRALGSKLIKKGMAYELFKGIAHLWVHALKAVEETLGEDFHVKQLSNGGEFLTILSILLKCEQPPMGPRNQV
ncbi:hypothetical protein ACQ4PT_025108 [Festuca glaucescens]